MSINPQAHVPESSEKPGGLKVITAKELFWVYWALWLCPHR